MRVLQKLFHHIRLEHLHLTLIRHAESRVKTNLVEIVTDDKQAERVNRRNLGIVYQRRLSLQMLVLRIFFQLLRHCPADTLTHLRRRGRGECHNQKPVNVDRVAVVCYHLYDALHQHRSLTASGSCRYKDIAVPGVNNPLLVGRKMHCHHCTPPFLFSVSSMPSPVPRLCRIRSIASS